MRYEIRELGVGGILDQAIAVTKDHFWLFFKIVLVVLLPYNLLTGWFLAPDIAALQIGQQPRAWFWLAALVNGLVVYPISNAAMIYAIASSYLSRQITVGTAFRRAGNVFLPLLGTMVLLWLILSIGMFLCLIPFFIFSLWYFLTIQVVVLEALSGRAALRRSRALMKGNVATAVVLGVLAMIIGWSFNFLQGFVPQIVLRSIVSSVIGSILFIFIAAAWVVFYFSCRAKTEHFDLALLADAVGTDDDQPPGTLDVSPGEAR